MVILKEKTIKTPKIPQSLIKAFGILKRKKANFLGKSRIIKQEWEDRIKSLEKLISKK